MISAPAVLERSDAVRGWEENEEEVEMQMEDEKKEAYKTYRAWDVRIE